MSLPLIKDKEVEDKVHWVVEVTDGTDTTLLWEDGRPRSWERVSEYCREHCLRIARMYIEFRSNRVEVGYPNAPGYYLSKYVGKLFGPDAPVDVAYIAGTLDEDGKVRVQRWTVPALIEWPLMAEDAVREVKFDSPNLIRDQTKLRMSRASD